MTPPFLRRLLWLHAADYRNGDDGLLLRVVREPTPTDDPEWFEVTGIEIDPFGKRLDERTVHVPKKVIFNPRKWTAP